MFVDVSAKQRTNIDGLLEAILLTADAALDLRANPDDGRPWRRHRGAPGPGRGPVATVLVQRGTLHVGDSIVAGNAYGRVRAMLDEHGEHARRGGPVPAGAGARPDLGARRRRQVPGRRRGPDRAADRRAAAGNGAQRDAGQGRASGSRSRTGWWQSKVEHAQPDHQGRRLRLRRGPRGRAAQDRRRRGGRPADHPPRRRRHHRRTTSTWPSIDQSDHHRLQRPRRRASAERAGRPRRRRHPVLLGDLPGHRRGRGRAQGHAQARVRGGRSSAPRRSARSSGPPSSATSPAASCAAARSAATRKARLVRDGVVVADNLPIESLRRFKDDATEVREGFECGIGLGSFNDIKVDDVIETFEMREKPRS